MIPFRSATNANTISKHPWPASLPGYWVPIEQGGLKLPESPSSTEPFTQPLTNYRTEYLPGDNLRTQVGRAEGTTQGARNRYQLPLLPAPATHLRKQRPRPPRAGNNPPEPNRPASASPNRSITEIAPQPAENATKPALIPNIINIIGLKSRGSLRPVGWGPADC
jgi:hypothetical protein